MVFRPEIEVVFSNQMVRPSSLWKWNTIFDFFTRLGLYYTDHWITFPPNQGTDEAQLQAGAGAGFEHRGPAPADDPKREKPAAPIKRPEKHVETHVHSSFNFRTDYY